MAAPLTTAPRAVTSAADVPPVVYPTPYRFTVEEYERMGEAGILTEDDRVELIAGEIIQRCPIGGPHIGCVNRLNKLLVQNLGDAAVVSVQNSIRLLHDGEPQPDFAILAAHSADGSAMPSSADVLLLIEVSDSSLAFDRGTKLPLYAQAGIPEVWIVNLTGRSIEQYSQPRNGAYETLHTTQHGDAISATLLPDLTLQVRDIIV
jgi:Uma2 family endonuclease